MIAYFEAGIDDRSEDIHIYGASGIKERVSEGDVDAIMEEILSFGKDEGAFKKEAEGSDFVVVFEVSESKISVTMFDESLSTYSITSDSREHVYSGVGGRISLQSDVKELVNKEKEFQVYMVGIGNHRSVGDVLGESGVVELVRLVINQILDYIVENYMVYTYDDDTLVIVREGRYDLRFIDRVKDVLDYSVEVFSMKVYPSVGVGYYVFQGEVASEMEIIDRALLALNRAREWGKGMCVRYEERLKSDSFKELELETDMRDALRNGEFYLVYQPQFSSKGMNLIGAEALIRWRHPDNGEVMPSDFIDLAERSGLITRIGEWVLGEVCRQQKEWVDRGYEVVPVAVNIGALHFKEDRFVEDIKTVLDRFELSADVLALEITEGSVIEDEVGMIAKLERLKRLGVKVSMDDFGKGYSSLNYLRKFPIDTLKIDKSFVKDIHMNKDNSEIVKTIISLAKTMDLKVIAEGVETDEAVEILNSLDCHDMQGFIFSKPITKTEMENVLENGYDLIV